MQIRTEQDSLGPVAVPSDALWGAQTQRSLENFRIGDQRFSADFIHAFALVKKAAALTNHELGKLDAPRTQAICAACDEVMQGLWETQFPLVVWQTGSGTQTNMNVNEVIANRASELAGGTRGQKAPVHPNDHVNLSQSSNDCFPTVMHVAAVRALHRQVLPALQSLHGGLLQKAEEFRAIVKIGRTHLMDATPLTLGQEFSAFAAQLAFAEQSIRHSLHGLHALALGGSAVGTGLNTHPEYATRVAAKIAALTGEPFRSADNKFAALAGHEALVQASGALRVLAQALFKIGNDVRLLASGPRCGIGELQLPENEPGSSIMPGKVNPTQSEALTMVSVQCFGLDAAIAFAGSQGHFQLNVFKPLIIDNFLCMARLLGDAMLGFQQHCVAGIVADEARITAHLNNSLMLVTALNPVLGYDQAAKIARKAHAENLTLKEAAVALGLLSAEKFDALVDSRQMTHP